MERLKRCLRTESLLRRKMSAVGTFYPDNSDEIISSFSYFNDLVDNNFTKSIYNKDVKALIVPHAGYMYSGFSANLAYRNIKTAPKRVVLIGPSHRVSFSGVSLVEYDFYETPLGSIESDRGYMSSLRRDFDFCEVEHQEHSTEVQFPFIKHYFPKATLVELIYGQNANLDGVIKEALMSKDTLLLISTDLSHFHNQEKANQLDRNCIKGVETFDIELLKKGEACGMQGVVSLLYVSKKLGLHAMSLDYRTSGDTTGDMGSVVGYYSAMIY